MANLTKDILVISHANCDDGFGASFAAWKKFGDNADYWYAFYNAEAPNVKGKEVYIFDFSYPREVLVKMKEEAKSLVVIDHHASAESRLHGLDYCIFDMKKSGAVLAWEYLHPETPFNELFYHIQDYDLWKFECPETENFSKALRSYPMDFPTWNSIWNSLEQHGQTAYDNFLAEGRTINRYYQKQLEVGVNTGKQWLTIGGVKGLGANLPAMFGSEAGNLLAKESGTFGFTYYIHRDGFVKCSLRSVSAEQCDVSKLAEKFGGGGHKTSSGFSFNKKDLMKILC